MSRFIEEVTEFLDEERDWVRDANLRLVNASRFSELLRLLAEDIRQYASKVASRCHYYLRSHASKPGDMKGAYFDVKKDEETFGPAVSVEWFTRPLIGGKKALDLFCAHGLFDAAKELSTCLGDLENERMNLVTCLIDICRGRTRSTQAIDHHAFIEIEGLGKDLESVANDGADRVDVMADQFAALSRDPHSEEKRDEGMTASTTPETLDPEVVERHVQASKLDGGEKPTLNAAQTRVRDYIVKNGPVVGSEIAKGLELAETTFRKYYVQLLKKHGMINDSDGRGYYFPKD